MLGYWELLRHHQRLHGIKALVYAAGLSEARYIEYPQVIDFLGAPAGRVLDAGSGHSPLPSLLAARGLSVVSLDLAPEGPRWQHQKAKGRLEAAQASVLDLPFADACFAAVLSISVLEHVDEDRQAMAELARVVKPGGLLIISVPISPQGGETSDPFFGIPWFYRYLLGSKRLTALMARLGVDRGGCYYERFYNRYQLQQRISGASGCVLEDWAIYWNWRWSRQVCQVFPQSFFTPLVMVLAHLAPRRPEESTHLGGIVLKLRKDGGAAAKPLPQF